MNHTEKHANCRVCYKPLPEKSLISYSFMPSQAQNFPDADNLDTDHGQDLKLYQCSLCGMVQLDAKPVSYYKEVIRASSVSAEMLEFRKSQFASFVNYHGLVGRKVLEVGCGKGEYLSILAENQIEAFGIEFNDTAVDWCRSHGLNVNKNYIDSADIKLSSGPFDGFIFLSFLEHFPSPSTALQGLYNNLADDAVGIVEVPNFDMIVSKKLFSEFISDHLLYFTEDTLKTTLNLNGFEVIECKPVWHEYILSATVIKRRQLDMTEFKNEIERVSKQFDDFIGPMKKEQVAIWGAGHQSLAMISILSLQDRVCCVLDSAEFKQGKFTPASHLPIFSPESLKSSSIRMLIIMAASYSDEVSKIVDQKYSELTNVAIYRETGLEILKK